jgi:hypothetical protein
MARKFFITPGDCSIAVSLPKNRKATGSAVSKLSQAHTCINVCLYWIYRIWKVRKSFSLLLSSASKI